MILSFKNRFSFKGILSAPHREAPSPPSLHLSHLLLITTTSFSLLEEMFVFH